MADNICARYHADCGDGHLSGHDNEWFDQFGLPVETVEAHPRYPAFSAAWLRKKVNVKLYLDSSVPFLKDRVGRTTRDTRQLFYLDAHWENYLPLREELELIFETYRNAIVVIDDFNVEDDPGYGFDSYGPDKTLNLDLLRRCNVPPMFIFYPSTRSDQETGMRRGWAVITTNAEMARKLESITLLRRRGESRQPVGNWPRADADRGALWGTASAIDAGRTADTTQVVRSEGTL